MATESESAQLAGLNLENLGTEEPLDAENTGMYILGPVKDLEFRFNSFKGPGMLFVTVTTALSIIV